MFKPHSKWITLRKPVEREGQHPIKSVRLRRLTGGDFGNLAFADILRMRVDAMVALIPKIAEPWLTRDEVAALDIVDLVALSAEIVGFLVDPQEAEVLVADAAAAEG